MQGHEPPTSATLSVDLTTRPHWPLDLGCWLVNERESPQIGDGVIFYDALGEESEAGLLVSDIVE